MSGTNRTLGVLIMIILPVVIVGKGFKLEKLGPDGEVLAPGKAHTFVFRLSNAGEKDVTLLPVFKLPPSWTILAGEGSVAPGAGETALKIYSVYVPSGASPGRYVLNYSLPHSGGGGTATLSIPVVVQEVRKIKVSLLDCPSFVVAGNRVEATFMVKNEGNSKEEILLNGTGCQVDGEGKLTAPAGAARVVRVFSDTGSGYPETVSRVLKLEAGFAGAAEGCLVVSAFARVDVVPAGGGTGRDAFMRFPVQLSGTFVGRQKGDEWATGFQGEIYGKGYLNEKRAHLFEFRVMGPNRFNMSSLGRYDEYFARFSSGGWSVHVGDKTYISSPLTGYARYGRGAELQYNKGDWEMGAFFHVPRFYSTTNKELSAGVQYNVNEKVRLGARYFSKTMSASGHPDHLYNITGQFVPVRRVLVETEFSQGQLDGKTGYGFMANLKVDRGPLGFSGQYLGAGKNFPGYYCNTRQVTANLNYRLTQKLGLNLNYHEDALNPQRDTLLGAAPRGNSFRGGINWRYLKGGTISVFAGQQEREDQGPARLFHYRESYLKGMLNQKAGHFNLVAEAVAGDMDNLFSEGQGQSWLLSSDVSSAWAWGGLGVFGSYQQAPGLNSGSGGQLYYGARLSVGKTGKTRLDMSVQNAYSVEEYYHDRSLFYIDLKQDIGRNHHIALRGNYVLLQKQVDKKDFAVLLKYTLDLNIPIKRTASYGNLTGTVSDAGAGRVEGIRLFCGGRSAVTDANGLFRFKGLATGKYPLLIDQTTVGLRDVPDERLPITVEIQPGENQFVFGMTHSVKIGGHIVLEREGKDRDNDSPDKVHVIIELSGFGETHRKLAPLDGDFVFDNLRPGQWKVSVSRNGLGKAYRVETPLFEVSPGPGEEINLEIIVVKKAKEIKFLQEEIKILWNTSGD